MLVFVCFCGCPSGHLGFPRVCYGPEAVGLRQEPARTDGKSGLLAQRPCACACLCRCTRNVTCLHTSLHRLRCDPTQVYRTSFLRQLLVLSHRAALSLLRNPAALVFQFVAAVGFALMVGGGWCYRVRLCLHMPAG